MSLDEVIVVGAGPAGCMAAIVLARAGARVRVIDRRRFPRHKLCGDTLNPGAMAILDGLALPGSGPRTLADDIRACSLPISGMTVTGPGGARVSGDYPHGLHGVALTRHVLDRLLLNAAIAEGATFDEGLQVQRPAVDGGRVTGVHVSSGSGTDVLAARVIVGADGRGSRLASALQLSRFARRPRRWAFGSYFTGVEGVGRRGEMHIRPGLYVGLAPLPGGLVNVCVVRELDGHRHGAIDRRQVIADAMRADAWLRERFSRARQVADVMSLGPLAVDSRGAGCPGLLLAGDAAGFVDPMTGDGLRFALRGGLMAGEAALAELSSGRPAFGDLHAARTREFAGKWRINRALRRLASSPHSLTAAAALAAWWPGPVQRLIGIAGDVGLVEPRTFPVREAPVSPACTRSSGGTRA